MAKRKLIVIGDKKLKTKNQEVANVNAPKIKQLIRDLRDTMRANELVGIAAPQIGENYQVFLTEPRKTKWRKGEATDTLRVYINPRVINHSKTECVIYEGCGCTGNIAGPVKRPKAVTVEATNSSGKVFQLTTNGLLGRVILHEIDHLNGMEFLQRITDNSKLVHFDYYKKFIRNSPDNKKNSVITKLEVKFL